MCIYRDSFTNNNNMQRDYDDSLIDDNASGATFGAVTGQAW